MVALRSWRAAGVQLVTAVEEGREAAEQLLFGEEIAAPTAGCCWRLCRWWSRRRRQLVVVTQKAASSWGKEKEAQGRREEEGGEGERRVTASLNI